MVDLEIWREVAADAWPLLGIIPNQEFVSASYLSPSPSTFVRQQPDYGATSIPLPNKGEAERLPPMRIDE